MPNAVPHTLVDPTGATPPIAWTLRVSARARRLRIIVRPGGVEVVAPEGWPIHGPHGVDAFVKSRADWVREAVRKVAARAPVVAPPPPLTDGAALLYRGRPIVLATATTTGRVARVAVDEAAGRVEVALGVARLAGGGEAREAALRAALVRYLRHEALRDGCVWAEAYGARLGRSAADVRLTNARRRWGSCSAVGVVRLHWRLAQAPPAAFEYVVAHEIAHLAVRDHSARFWATVERLMPDFGERRAALKAWERGMASGGWVP